MLSSRRLIVLLEGLPRTSRFKTVAELGGEWSDWTDEMYILAAIYNEAAISNANFYNVNRSEDSDPIVAQLMLSPKQRTRQAELEEREQAEREQSDATFYREIGWTL